jgi:hypothetical protein
MGVAPEAIVEELFFEYRLKYSMLHLHNSTRNSLMIISSGARSTLPMVVAPQSSSRMFSGINSSYVGANLLSPPFLSLLANCHIQYLSSTCICRVYFCLCVSFMMSAAKFLYTSLWMSANRFVGSAVILYFSPPVSGLPLPLRVPRFSPRSFSGKVY